MNKCTGCPALSRPMNGKRCCLGVMTSVKREGFTRVRYPLETCPRPNNSGELAEYIQIMHEERRG